MVSKKKTEFDLDRISQCLDVIRQLYTDYTPQEITEAFAINRSEITAREELAKATEELKLAQERLDTLTKE